MKKVFFLLIMLVAAVSFAADKAGTKAYVQGGLVACWDGIEKGDDSSVWPDVVGGRSFSLTGVTFEDDRVVFAGNGNTSFGVLGDADSKATFEVCKNGTLEVVFNQNGSGNMVLLQSTSNAGMALGISGSQYLVGSSLVLSAPVSAAPSTRTNTISVTYGRRRVYHDGTDITKTGGDYFSGASATQTFIGTRASRALSFNGSVYCIRLYDRELTTAEISANHAVDELRFADDRDAGERSGNLYVVPSDAPYRNDGLPQYGLVTGLAKDDRVEYTAPAGFNLTVTDEVVFRGWNMQVLGESGWTTVASTADRSCSFAFPGDQARLVCNLKRKIKNFDIGSGYQQVEWIESTGKQYFDTGIIGRSGLAGQVDIMFRTNPTFDNSVLGSSNGTRIYLFHVFSGYCYGYNGYYSSGVKIYSDIRYRVETELRSGYQHMYSFTTSEVTNLNYSASSDAKSYTNNLTMTLLTLRTGPNNVGSAMYSARIYSTTIWSVDDNGNRTPLRQFVPCRRKDDPTVAGLYDLVSGEFFGNYSSSSEPFNVGPDVKGPKGLTLMFL